MSVVGEQERANIDMLISTAKKYPRDLTIVKRNMELMACLDEETAEECNYHVIRDGHSIEGPSIRLAEIAFACWGNLRAGARVGNNDGRMIGGQAYCHDLETNNFVSWETIRRITDKRGRTYSDDMIMTTGNAAAAIAYRNAIFKVIPGALIKGVAEKAKKFAVGDLKTLTQRRTRLLKRFAAIGVNEAMILKLLKYESADQITLSDVEKLIGIGTAIREGTTSVEEQFRSDEGVAKPNISAQEGATEKAQESPNMETAGSAQKPPKSNPEATEKPKTSKKNGSHREQIEAKLAADGIPVSEFLKILDGFGIPVGDSLDSVDEKHLKMALANWENQVLKERNK
jgi:hypothetical protein